MERCEVLPESGDNWCLAEVEYRNWWSCNSILGGCGRNLCICNSILVGYSRSWRSCNPILVSYSRNWWRCNSIFLGYSRSWWSCNSILLGYSRSGRWRIWVENRRRGINDLTSLSPGSEEVRVVKFQEVRFRYIFLGKDVVEEFQYSPIIAQDGVLGCIGEVGDPMVDGWSRSGSNSGFWGSRVQCSGQVLNMIAISGRQAN